MLSEKISELRFDQPYIREIPAIADRQFWENSPTEFRTSIIQKAETYLHYEWPLIRASQFLEFFKSGDRMAHEKPYMDRRNPLIYLFLAECFENKGRFLDDITDGVILICEETFWGVSAHARGRSDGIRSGYIDYVDLFGAETAQTLSIISYVLADKLDERVSARVAYEVENRVLIPFLRDRYWYMGYPDANGKTGHINNWNPWISSNVVAALLYTDIRAELKNQVLQKIGVIVDRYIARYPDDGGCDEGCTYWSLAPLCLFDVLRQLYIATDGKINFFQNEKIIKMGEFLPKMYVGNGYIMNFADAKAKVHYPAGMVYAYAKAIGSKALENVARENYIPLQESIIGIRTLRRMIVSMSYEAELQKEYQKEEVSFAEYLPESEMAIVKDDSLHLAVKGSHNGESHNHNDVGSYILYIDKCPTVIDVGTEIYTKKTFSEERYTIWTMQSAWHNLPTVNGIMEKDGREYRARNTAFHRGSGICVFTSDIAGAYPPDAALATLQRTVTVDVFSKSVTVEDAYCFQKEKNTVSEHMMLCKKPTVKENKLSFIIDSGREITVEAKDCDIAVEEKYIGYDSSLAKSWDTNVYRVTFTAHTGKEHIFTYTIQY